MKNNITYHKEGDYLIPNIIVNEMDNKDYHIGKYGRLRLAYLKEHRKGFYTELMIEGLLPYHLAEIDQEASKRVKDIITLLAEKEGVNEDLKANNQMEWVKSMNNIKSRAEEIVLKEFIYG